MEVLGYRTCAHCSVIVLDVIAEKTSGLCPGCWRAGIGDLRTQVRIAVEGRTNTISVKPKNRARNARQQANRKLNQRKIDHIHTVTRAKERAMKRLRMLFPAEYQVLLAEARGELGLDPWPIQMALEGPPAAAAAETLRALASYPPSHGHAEDMVAQAEP